MPISPTLEEWVELNSKRVFSKEGNDILIGGEKIKPELFKILKEQATYLETSQLWEIFNATVIQESANLALLQSKEWDHVVYAKALKYWRDIFKDMIIDLKG